MKGPSTATGGLSGELLGALDRQLADTDRLLGQVGRLARQRQPVHTVYLPADHFTETTCLDWGRQATALVDRFGGLVRLCADLGLGEQAADIAARVGTKLNVEPVEDLRLDFEDGYRAESETQEDADAVAAARKVAATYASGTAPPFIGIRFKSLEPRTRRRGLRTLDLFISTLAALGPLPPGLRLTLPKVTTSAQVSAMAGVCTALEQANGLRVGQLGFEIQVEAPRLILDTDGRIPLPAAIDAGHGRVVGLHFGTYDYTAALGIAAGDQALDHPAADHAKQIMLLVAAGRGLRLSDGSTNIVPVGTDQRVQAAWVLHARLVQRALRRGLPQGWDIHPGQLPTRYAATYAFYRDRMDSTMRRLAAYHDHLTGGVLDEPATVRALAGHLLDGIDCQAINPEEVSDRIGLSIAQLLRLVVDPYGYAIKRP